MSFPSGKITKLAKNHSIPFVDIVCVSYGSEKHLEKLLPLLAKQQDVDLNMIVVEQKKGAKKPSTISNCDVYITGENLGYAGGNNRGLDCVEAIQSLLFL